VEKEVNPAFQSNSFELGIWGLSQRSEGLSHRDSFGASEDAHGRIYFELGILNFGFY